MSYRRSGGGIDDGASSRTAGLLLVLARADRVMGSDGLGVGGEATMFIMPLVFRLP